jgi:predicted DsbA family dithiol-disulfide isomerase
MRPQLKMDTEGVPRLRGIAGKYKEAVQTDVLEAMKIGADATPTFRAGQEHAAGRGWRTDRGAQPYSMFEEKFKQLGVTK